MLTNSINPVAFTIGSLQIRWYGIMMAMAVVVLLVVMVREAKRRGITQNIYGIFFSGIVGGIIGGRSAYVINDWSHFAAHPLDVFGFWGMAQNGMIVGVIAAALIYMGVTMRFSTLLSLGDVLAGGAPLGLAIARIGCTINGCCYAQLSPFSFFPLAMAYTPRDTIPPEYWGGAAIRRYDLPFSMGTNGLWHRVAIPGKIQGRRQSILLLRLRFCCRRFCHKVCPC